MIIKTSEFTKQGHRKCWLESLCDAFGKGFDQAERNEKNPYPNGSDPHYCYEYGKEVANGQG